MVWLRWKHGSIRADSAMSMFIVSCVPPSSCCPEPPPDSCVGMALALPIMFVCMYVWSLTHSPKQMGVSGVLSPCYLYGVAEMEALALWCG